MRSKGRITNWKDDKGFGFISPITGGNPVFAHIKAFNNRKRRPVIGEIVTYDLASDSNGRPQAKNIAFAGERSTPPAPYRHSNLPLATSVLFLCMLAGAVITRNLPLVVIYFYLGASFVAFCAYALDKSAAKNNMWRTPESTLHLFSMIGGWPGALFAQRLLRHKSKKQSFRTVFWVTVLLNFSALSWLLFTPDGIALLFDIAPH